MTYDEFLEKRRAQQFDKGVSPSKTDVSQSYEDFRAERALRLNSDEQAATNYFDNAAVYLDRFQAEIKNPQPTTYQDYSKRFEQLESDSKRVKNYIETLKGTENYDSMKSAFDSYSSAIANARAQLKAPAADAHIKSYLQDKYNSEKILSDLRQGKTTAAQAAAEYGLDGKQLQANYDELRAHEKQADRESKYGGLQYDELVGLLKSPDSIGQKVYDEIRDEYGVYFKDYSDFDKSRIFESRGEKYGLSGEQVREIYDRISQNDDKHYASAALGDADRDYVVSRILQSGTAEQLQQLKKELPVAKHYDSLRYQLNQAIEEKNEEESYLNIAKNDPRVTQVMESIAAIDRELPGLASTTGAPTVQKGQFSNIMDAQETRAAYMRELEAHGYNAEKMVKYYQRYRERMENEENQKAVRDWTSQNGFNAAIASIGSVPINMIGSLGDALKIALANLSGDGWYDPKGTANYTAQNIRSTTTEMIDEATKDSGAWNYWAKQLYSSGMSGGDMVLAAAANAIPVVGQAASNAMFFSSAGVNAANEVIENGGDLSQATRALIATGGAELLFERMSLDKLEALAASGNVTSAKEYFKSLAKQAFVEGSEEFNTTLANTFTDALINGGNNSLARKAREYAAQGMSEKDAENAAMKDWTQEIIDDAVGGALVGGIAGGVAGGYNYVKNNREFSSLGKELMDSEDFDLDMLIEQGKQSESPETGKLAERLSKKQEKGEMADPKSVGRLQTLLQSESDMNERHLSEKLKGELTADEKAIVAKVQNGSVLSKADVQTVNDSPRVAEAISRFTNADPEEIKTIDFDEKRSHQENFKASDNGKALVDDEEFTGGLEIASVNPRRGLIVYDLNMPDGTIKRTTSDKIRFKSAGEALLHEKAASYNTEQARAFVENYREGQDVNNYAREWNLYSNYGRMAVNLDVEKMNVGGTLSSNQKFAAYQQGLNSRIAHNQVQTIVNSANELKPYTSQNQGTFAYNVPAVVRLTKEQAQMRSFFRDMSVVTGLNIELFQSQTDENGNYTGENGSYDPATNTLRVDINAGLMREGEEKAYQYSMLNTAAHELTHVAKQGNKYALLREAVIAALGTTEKNFKTLVEKKFNQFRSNKRYDRMTDKELTELADEEVICDSCETMLQGNSGFFENLYRKDKNLAKKFVDAIKNLVEKIKAFVTARKHANTEYGKALLEVADDLYDQIQQLWNEAVESGLEAAHTQTVGNINSHDYIVKEQARQRKNGRTQGLYSGKSIDDYSRIQYNCYGWVVINKVLTVNELNRFYKEFANKEMLKFKYKKNYDGYYMIPTGDVSMHDSKIVFVSGTSQNPYIDRVIEINGIDKDDISFWINEVIDYAEYDNSYEDIEAYAGDGVFRTYTPENFASYSELKERNHSESIENTGGAKHRTNDAQNDSGTVVYQDRDYLSAVERGDMETAQRMVDEAARAAGYDMHLYHGSKSGGGFTVFKGWQYFTESKPYAERYTQRDTGKGLYSVFVKSSRLFDTRKPADRALFKQYRNEYGMGELQESGLPDWTDGYDLSDIIEETNLDYDGIILDEGGDLVNGKPVSRGVSYVIRSSEQIKSADPVTYDDDGNVIPLSERFKTDNADIRYQDRNLIAVHNLSEEKLLKSLKLGGFPMPSIAITKHDMQHEGYGDISLIFSRDTIDPGRTRDNKVYGGDAWTPKYPRIEYEANYKVARQIYERANQAAAEPIEFFNPSDLYPQNIDDALNSHGGLEGLIEHYRKNYGFKNFYLKEKTGESVKILQKEERYTMSQYEVEECEFLYTHAGEIIEKLKGISGKTWIKEYRDTFEKARTQYFRSVFPDLSEEEIENIFDSERAMDVLTLARKVYNYHKNGAETVKVVDDFEGTHKEIDSRVNQREYETWLRDLFRDVEGKSGIRNNLDRFTASGKSRNFSQLHYAETLDNVVKAMKKERNGDTFFAAAGLWGVAAKSYGTFSDIKADSERLKSLSEEEFSEIRQNFGDRFSEIAQNIIKNSKALSDNPFTNLDYCFENILDAVRTKKTKSGLMRELKDIYGDVINDSVVTDILDLIADVGNMPTKYFEAKPQRAVGFDEVKAAVVPSDTSEKVKAALKNAGIPVHEYEKGNEASRAEATQKAINTEYTNAKGETQSDLRFQDRDYSVEPEDYGDLFDDLFTDEGDLSFGEEADTRRAESIIEKMIEYDAESAAYFLSYSAGEIAQNTLGGLKDIELSDSSYLKIAKKFYNNSTVRMNINSETIAEQVKSFVMLYDDGVFDSFDAFISEIVKWNEQNVRSDKFTSPENMLTNAYTLISYIAEEKAGYASSVGEMSEKYARMERASNKAKAEAKQLKAENQRLNRSLSYQEDVSERYRSESSRSRAEIAKLQMLNKQLEKARTKAEQQADRRIERTVKRYNAKLDKQKLKAGEQKAAALDRMRERYEKLLTAEKAKAKDRRSADHDKVVERYEKRIAELKEKAEQQKRAIREDRDTKLIAEKKKRQADLKALRDNRDKKEYVRKIKKVASELQQWALHPTDKHFVPQEFLRSGFYRAVNDITEALIISDNTKIADKLRKIAAGVQDLQGKPEFQYDIDPVIAAEMNQLANAIDGRKVDRTLTLRQAEDIYKALRLIKDSVVNARKLIFENETRDVVQMGVAIINEQRALKPAFVNRNLNNIKKFFLTPERVHNIINGYNEDSALNKVFQEIKLGIRKKNTFYMDANKMFDAYRNAHVKALDRSQHTVREVKWRDNAGHERTTRMTGMQAMQLIMTWNREAADNRLVHMRKGGVSILNPDKLAKGNIKQAYEKRAHVLGINESFITGVSRSLTDFERGYIDIAEQFFNGMAKNAINEASLKLRHFETATSEYYIPVKVDGAEIVKEIEGVKHDSSVENMGMLKSIVPYSDKSVLIHGLDNVISKHIENVGNYYGLAIPIRNMNKVLNVSSAARDNGGNVLSRDSVKMALEANWGKLGTDIYEQLLIDLQNSRAPKNETMQDVNAVIRKIRSNFVTATLTMNPSVVLKQSASYSVAGVYLDQTALAKGSADMLKYLRPGKYQALLDEIDSHTAQHYMRRAGLSSLEIAAAQESWFKNSKLGRVINNAKPMQKAHGLNPSNWIQEVDCLTTAALWCATKAQIDNDYKKAGKQVDTDEYWRDVADLYDKVIEDTQPMYDAMHRPEILKSSNEFIKSVFMFKTQPLQNSGIIYDSIGRLMQNKKDKAAWKQLRKAIMSQGKSLLVFAGMSLFVAFALHRMGRYADEDDEVTAQSIFDTFIKDVIQNGAGVVLPFGGNEGAGAVINMIDTGKLDASSMVQDNVAETVTDFLGAGTNLVNTIGEQFDKEKHDTPDADAIAQAAEKLVITWVSDIFGVPVKNAKNIVKGGVDWAKDIADGGETFKPEIADLQTKQVIHSYEKHFENGESKIADSRIQEFYDLKLQSNQGKDDPEKEARNAVRDAFTTYYKKKYKKAFNDNNTAELERIRKILTSQSKYMKWGTKNTPLSEKLREWQKEAAEEK